MRLIKCKKEEMPTDAIWIGKGSKYYNKNPWFPNKKLFGLAYRQYISIQEWNDTNIISELKGKNLTCDCDDGKNCHGHVLIEMVNEFI